MEKRVVITGMGIYSCLGKNLDEVRDALYTAKSGIVLDPKRKEMGFRSGLTAPPREREYRKSRSIRAPRQARRRPDARAFCS